MNQTRTPSRYAVDWIARAALALAMVGFSLQAMSCGGGEADAAATAESAVTYTVERGPLLISVTESGTIRSQQAQVIKSEVEGRRTIISLIDEGKHVKPDDLLVELDSSQLQEQKLQQQIKVRNAESNYIRARETLAVTKNQAESDIAAAELDFRFAKLDLKKYTDGDYPQELQQASNDIRIAEEELSRAEDRLEWSQKLADEGFITRSELEADILAHQKRKLDVEMAKRKLDVLKNFTHTREVAQLESNVEQTERALERVKRKASADVIEAEADLQAKQLAWDREKDQLEHMTEQIEKCEIRAPVAGMVVYATTGKGNWRRNAEPLEEGQEIRERQELIRLPTASSMMAEIKIHESALEKVKVGQPVNVTTDALPGRTFHGKLEKIAPLPDASSWMNPDRKVYNAEVGLTNSNEELRSGMSCKAEIIVARYDSTLAVPVQSVVRVKGQPTAWVVDVDGSGARPIEIGLDNGRLVRVTGGLDEGEQVLLAPPLTASAAPRTSVEREEAGEAGDAPADESSDASEASGAFDMSKLRKMTPEQRREAFENLSEEQKQKLREAMQQQRGQSSE